jgi:hypothetical protein
MIVFYKFPRGSTVFGHKRIYGYLEPYPPVQVPWRIWLNNQNSFIAASYDKCFQEENFHIYLLHMPKFVI